VCVCVVCVCVGPNWCGAVFLCQKITLSVFLLQHAPRRFPSLQVLEIMNKVNEKDILLASKIFDRLDANGDGSLNQDDMKMIRAAAQVRDTEQLKHENRRRAEESRIREQQQEEAANQTFVGNLTGHIYDALSGLGLVSGSPRNSSHKKSTSNGRGSNMSGSKAEDLLLVSRDRVSSYDERDSDDNDLTVPLALNDHSI